MGLFRKMRIVLTPRSWLLKRRLSNGAIVYGMNRAGYGGRGVYLLGDSIEPELRHLESFLDADGVFVDIGANTGVYTLKAAKHFDNKGIVIAVEPFLDVLATLSYSVKVNGFSNVRLRALCVGAHTSIRTLWMNNNKPNSFSLTNRVGDAPGLSVLTVSLDELCEWEGIQRLDYLKIDAEGAEQEILSGAIETINQYRPIIQIEAYIRDLQVKLSNYSVFKALKSPNKVYIPNEHSRIHLPSSLGWTTIEGQ